MWYDLAHVANFWLCQRPRFTKRLLIDMSRMVLQKRYRPVKSTQPIHVQCFISHITLLFGRTERKLKLVQIVFDASAKDSNGKSLNSCIEAGPSLQPDLGGILLRFRKKKIVATSDIEKMFLQIGLREQDRDSHRYWVETWSLRQS